MNTKTKDHHSRVFLPPVFYVVHKIWIMWRWNPVQITKFHDFIISITQKFSLVNRITQWLFARLLFALQIMFECSDPLRRMFKSIKIHGKLKSHLGTLPNSYRERFPTGRKNPFSRKKILPSQKILPAVNRLENPWYWWLKVHPTFRNGPYRLPVF